MKLVCISDTHCQLDKVEIPPGDLLIHAGDLTYRGNIAEITQELSVLSKLKDKFTYGIVIIAGNHDFLPQRNLGEMQRLCNEAGIHYLQDQSLTINGYKIYGTPWQPEFCNWAFNLPRGKALANKWAMIPDDTDVLITHGPPMGIMDDVDRFNSRTCQYDVEHVGCTDLRDRVEQINPKVHVFGHIHKGYGVSKGALTTFVNASICTESYTPDNPPIVVEI